MPDIIIHDVGLRDGFQIEKKTVPTEQKIQWIDALMDSGIDIIQIGSFVHKEKVPQMADAEAVIAKLDAAAATYPYATTYSAWPGPNSNTFVAHLAREIPEMRLALPAHAVGKDYLSPGQLVARSPSGTGRQLSLNGLLGVIVGGDEGFELNVLGLVVGVDPLRPALKVPGFGALP